MSVVLLIASNLFAADGDLIVEGNVGIGTTTPTARLDVDSTNTVAGDFAVTRTTNQYLKAVYSNYIDNVEGATTGGQALFIQATHNTGASFSNYYASIT